MEKHGFNREKYSCIYTLSKNAGSKYIRLFTDSDADNTIVFDGSCKTSLSARANPQTKQFQESILRHLAIQNNKATFPTGTAMKNTRSISFDVFTFQLPLLKERVFGCSLITKEKENYEQTEGIVHNRIENSQLMSR